MMFHELPDALRMSLRDAAERLGCEVTGYYGESVQLALPADRPSIFADLAAAGLREMKGSDHYFPLGSDAPPAGMRHDGRYPGSRGFWRFARFVPN